MAPDYSLLQNERIEVPSVEFSKASLKYGAKQTVFVDSRVTLKSRGMPALMGGARFSFRDCLFENCAISGDGVVADLELRSRVTFRGCCVSGGPFKNVAFGPDWDEVAASNGPGPGRVVGCDFREADLRGVRFFETPESELQLPAWPYITVLARSGDQILIPPSPTNRGGSRIREEVQGADWDDDDMRLAVKVLVFGVCAVKPYASIQVCHAEDIVRYGAGSMERLRTALDRFAHPAIRY